MTLNQNTPHENFLRTPLGRTTVIGEFFFTSFKKIDVSVQLSRIIARFDCLCYNRQVLFLLKVLGGISIYTRLVKPYLFLGWCVSLTPSNKSAKYFRCAELHGAVSCWRPYTIFSLHHQKHLISGNKLTKLMSSLTSQYSLADVWFHRFSKTPKDECCTLRVHCADWSFASVYKFQWDVITTPLFFVANLQKRYVVFLSDRVSKLRAPCTKMHCTLFGEENKADSSCRAAERVSNRTRIESNWME